MRNFELVLKQTYQEEVSDPWKHIQAFLVQATESLSEELASFESAMSKYCANDDATRGYQTRFQLYRFDENLKCSNLELETSTHNLIGKGGIEWRLE